MKLHGAEVDSFGPAEFGGNICWLGAVSVWVEGLTKAIAPDDLIRAREIGYVDVITTRTPVSVSVRQTHPVSHDSSANRFSCNPRRYGWEGNIVANVVGSYPWCPGRGSGPGACVLAARRRLCCSARLQFGLARALLARWCVFFRIGAGDELDFFEFGRQDCGLAPAMSELSCGLPRHGRGRVCRWRYSAYGRRQV